MSFGIAAGRYGEIGVDVDLAIAQCLAVPVSIHCWQADDVKGFEGNAGLASGGIVATGSYPGCARNGDELRQDYEKVFSLVPGIPRANLHAMYAEPQTKVERDELLPEHFARWIEWASAQGIGLDFNPTYFAHPMAADGFTLSHKDRATRGFWIRHGIACRHIAAAMSAKSAVRSPQSAINNHWIPDGAKDSPADRWSPRERLIESYNEIFKEPIDGCTDSVESKLFGLGSEDYVVGSFEFYSQYVLSSNRDRSTSRSPQARKPASPISGGNVPAVEVGDLLLCLDMGHFHPTETIADKLSALLQFQKKLLIHASRPIRWDSDHVTLFNDDLRAVFQELFRDPRSRQVVLTDALRPLVQGSAGSMGNVGGEAISESPPTLPILPIPEGRKPVSPSPRAAIALDFFDASINRIAAYVIGIRAVRKALLWSLLEPVATMQGLEREGKLGQKLALMERLKIMPFGDVWDEACRRADVPSEADWIKDVERYEYDILSKRG
ncbi:MAG: L-rhamnose isomerase [Fimbriimonadaceae bacterium]